jgi:hypothetical protein
MDEAQGSLPVEAATVKVHAMKVWVRVREPRRLGASKGEGRTSRRSVPGPVPGRFLVPSVGLPAEGGRRPPRWPALKW